MFLCACPLLLVSLYDCMFGKKIRQRFLEILKFYSMRNCGSLQDFQDPRGTYGHRRNYGTLNLPIYFSIFFYPIRSRFIFHFRFGLNCLLIDFFKSLCICVCTYVHWSILLLELISLSCRSEIITKKVNNRESIYVA